MRGKVVKGSWLSRAVVALLSIMLLIGSAPVAVAEPGFRFSVSATSGLPGLRLEVGQIDPCPASDGFTQYIEMAFVDAAGVRTTTPGGSLVNSDGSWIGPVQIYIPSRRISNYDPVTHTQDAAIGEGQVQVRCTTPNGAASVTREYSPVAFTVTGPSPRFALSTARTHPGDTMQIQAVNPCPLPVTSITGVIERNGTFVSYNALVDSVTGMWNANVTIPKVITDPMGGNNRDFPLGKYRVAAWCFAPGIGSPYAYYGEELLEVAASPIRYVSQGDSYSSGEGAFDYFDTHNSCHRSRLGYPSFVAQQMNLGTPLLAACSGAVTDDFFVTNPRNLNEPAQLSRLNADTEIVTLTIGGNDAGFAEILRRCIEHPDNKGWGCARDKTLDQNIKRRLKALAGGQSAQIEGRPIHSLLEVYRNIHLKAPHARIYVAGYPSLFGENKASYRKIKDAPGNAACFMPAFASVSYNDAQWINKQGEKLNRTIKEQVERARREGIQVTYVPPDLFVGHGICDDLSPWINELIVDSQHNPQPEGFHPNSEGYWLGYGLIFQTMIEQG